MHSAFVWKYVRITVILGVICVGLWSAFSTAEGQETMPRSMYLPSLIVKEGATPSPTPGGTVPPGESDVPPIAAWRFQEGSGSRTTDNSGHGFDGLLDNPAWIAQGNEGGALMFDGEDDSVRITGLDLSGDSLTIAALIKMDSADHLQNHDPRIISKGTGTGEQDQFWLLSTRLFESETRLRFRLKVNGTTETLIAGENGEIVPDTWTHVAATFDGETMHLYKNGFLVGSASHSGAVNDDATVEAWIGDQPSEPGVRPWDGMIDDVQLFDAALSPSQIQNLIPVGLVPSDSPPGTPAPTASPPDGGGDNETPAPTPFPPDGEDDNAPPVISNVEVVLLGSSAVVRWDTDEPTTGEVVFGTDGSYGLGPVGSSEPATNHFVRLNDLAAETTYHYQVTAEDGSGNIASTNDATFTTGSPGASPTNGFLDTMDGNPSSPLPWRPDNWDVTVHSRDKDTLYELQQMDAHHGPNCEPPLATHPISAYEDAVYQCKDHVMTALRADGYGLIYLTPAHQVDFTDGPATIRFDVSTLRTSERDWIDIYVSPMEDHLQLALAEWLPDLSGEPKRGLKVEMDHFEDLTPFRAFVIDNHEREDLDAKWWAGYEEYLEPSAKNRSTFELQISRTHIKFGMPDHDLWWIDSEIEPLDWTVGVVQLGHHSYTPGKDCSDCGPNTWHWDNVSIQPARPFTMIHADKRYVDSTINPQVSFDSPAPENAFLRFAGIGQNIEVSFDGGATWEAARLQEQMRHTPESFWSYFTPIPAGVQTVHFRGDPYWGGDWHVRDLSIWAE